MLRIILWVLVTYFKSKWRCLY